MEDNTQQQNTTQTIDTQTDSQQQPEVTPNVTVRNTGSSIQIDTKPVTMEDVDPTKPATEQDTETKPQPETTDSVQTNVDTQLKTEDDLKADLKGKGVDFDVLSKEFNDNGELSQSSIEALDKAGYPKSVVDAYINGMQANVDKFVSQVQGFAGGEQGYAQLVQFMNTQPVEVRKSFNETLNTGKLGQIQLAISGIKAQMVSKYGTSNPTIMTGSVAQSPATGYSNTQEMVDAMSDPRYQVDPAYTREVIRKVQHAAFFKK